METAEVVRWLYALGIGFFMFAAALFLFTLYRFTGEALFAAYICMVIGVALFVAGFAVSNFRI